MSIRKESFNRQTFLSDYNQKGTHWSFIEIDYLTENMIYDSLGWSMPKALEQKIKPIIDTVCELTGKFVAFPTKGRVFHAHTEGHINSSGFYECTSGSFVYYSRQLCFNICGTVAAVMSAIALLLPSLLDVVLKARRHMEQLNAFLWLSEPTRHSSFFKEISPRNLHEKIV